ncbi:MAG: SIS domain-containing protein [Candidatus Binataceae bacterium]|nr:SIS domain-containing protein [Candidatus Binataceae bacterium]
MADRRLDVVGCGSMVVDLFYRTPRIVGADEKIVLDTHRAGAGMERAAVGGVVLNHLGWARILGLNVGICGKMGDDRHGEFLRNGMDRLGIRHHLTLDGGASSFSTVFVDGAGNRAIYMVRGATAELKHHEIARRHGPFLRGAHLISTEISQLPLRTVIALLQLARANSIPTVLDVDVPPSDACSVLGTPAELDRALRLATYLKPAKSAARELVESDRDVLKLAQAIRARYGTRAVVITDGDRGCAIAAKNTVLRVPAFKVHQIDTTGAGDAFLGAMLAGLRWKLPWDVLGKLGNAAGAVCVSRLGAFPSGFELREEIVKLYGQRLPTRNHPRGTTRSNATGAVLDPTVEVKRFFDRSIIELGRLKRRLEIKDISQAVALIRTAEAIQGRVHVTGVGKPEHVARYAASLFCSVGTPATFLHATETLHGSLGQVDRDDVVIAISNSGNTSELIATATAIKEHGAQLIAITGNDGSELSQIADLVIHAPVKEDGGVLGLAPRISVLGQVYVLAALSVALEVSRGLTLEEYSRWHRAGTLGEAARHRAAAQSATPRKLKVVAGRRNESH